MTTQVGTATIGRVQEWRNRLVLLLGVVLQLGALHPVPDEDEDARPRPVASTDGLNSDARSECLRQVMPAFRRVAVVVPDQIAPDRRGIDRLQMGQMRVIGLACIKQILDRQ